MTDIAGALTALDNMARVLRAFEGARVVLGALQSANETAKSLDSRIADARKALGEVEAEVLTAKADKAKARDQAKARLAKADVDAAALLAAAKVEAEKAAAKILADADTAADGKIAVASTEVGKLEAYRDELKTFIGKYEARLGELRATLGVARELAS
jgi:phage shock protein A